MAKFLDFYLVKNSDLICSIIFFSFHLSSLVTNRKNLPRNQKQLPSFCQVFQVSKQNSMFSKKIQIKRYIKLMLILFEYSTDFSQFVWDHLRCVLTFLPVYFLKISVSDVWGSSDHLRSSDKRLGFSIQIW